MKNMLSIAKGSKLTKTEVELLISKINMASHSVFGSIVKLKQFDGHLLMGYESIKECLRAKTDLGDSYISRNLSACNLCLCLEPKLEHLQLVTEATFRPLIELKDDDLAHQVWTHLIANHKHGKRIKSNHVREIIKELGIEAKTLEKVVIAMDKPLQRTVDKHVSEIGSLIYDNTTSHEEWKEFCKVIYQKLLANWEA